MTGGRDRGSAALYVVWCALAVLAVAAGLGAVGLARVGRARAASVADLAALSAAAALGRGEPPCEAGRAVAERSGARLISCVASPGGVVGVVVEVAFQGPMARFGAARAAADAGPAETDAGAR
ncbi:MAG TPA: Rv3654c family TadE-like protein [Mycobacteriales bacterium]|nr:Rv3654c family TadE-like protein [Mycobacteriales bacterium]